MPTVRKLGALSAVVMALMLAAGTTEASSVVTTTRTSDLRLAKQPVPDPHATLLTVTGTASSLSKLRDHSCADRTCLAILEGVGLQPGVTSRGTSSTSQSLNFTKGKVELLARLPRGVDFATAPVAAGDGHEIVALVGPSVSLNSSQRLAKIELPSGRFIPGPEVSGTAGLFTGSSGQAFLLRWSTGTTGRLELSRVPGDLRAVKMLQLPLAVARPNQTVAVAPLPNKDEAWVADGGRIELVDLAKGALVASLSLPGEARGPVGSLALAGSDGPLYASFCASAPRHPSCGAVAEINPANGSIISERWVGGLPGSLVATAAGAWLSSGLGGNGRWMYFLSRRGLRLTNPNVLGNGWLDLLATGNVVWASFGGPPMMCFSVSAVGALQQFQDSASLNPLVGAGFLLEAESPGGLLLLATLNPGTLVAVPIPPVCRTVPSTTSPRARLRSFERLARHAETSSYLASYKIDYPGGTVVTTTVARLGDDLMWVTSSPTGLEEFIKTERRSYLCHRALHGGPWSCRTPGLGSTNELLGQSEPRVLYDSMPTLPLQPDETVRVTSEHKAGRNLTCLSREWGGDPRYASDWCVTPLGVFTSAVLESAAAGPKYQHVTMTAYSDTVVPSLFVSPAAPAI